MGMGKVRVLLNDTVRIPSSDFRIVGSHSGGYHARTLASKTI